VNSYSKLDYICNCETPDSISFDSFRRGGRCPKCRDIKVKDKLKLPYDEVKQYFEDHNCELLEKEYKNANTKMKYRCNCGNKKCKITFGHFKGGGRCKECKIERMSGKNSSCYKHDLTEEDRQDRRLIPEYGQWREKVYKRDDYTCQVSGKKRGGNLVAHHLESYGSNIELRTVVSNGVTMDVDCHIEFHKKYGYGNNTREQFEEFLKEYQKNS